MLEGQTVQIKGQLVPIRPVCINQFAMVCNNDQSKSFFMGGRGGPHFHGANDIFALRWGFKLHGVHGGTKHDVIMSVKFQSIKAYYIGKIPGWVLNPPLSP